MDPLATSSPQNIPIDENEFANNDGWHDDVSDGPVNATVQLKSGETIDAAGAWVICAIPKFAPYMDNVITLYDVLRQVAVDNSVGGVTMALQNSNVDASRLTGDLSITGAKRVVASQVQSTFWLVPVPVATRAPVASATVTVHGRGALRRAWKRTGPPMAPRTDGA